LRIVGYKDLAIAVRVVFVLGSDVTIGRENDEAAVRTDVAHGRSESAGTISELDDEWVRSWTRCLGRNGGKRATDQRSHDYGAQKPENLLHEFLRNTDADTSRLDALGELSSVAVKSIIAATGDKERPF
jgi:hypothetical protein